MKYLSYLIIILAGINVLSSCKARLPETFHNEAGWELHVGPGTEDIEFDHSIGQPRLIISCADRRSGTEDAFGGIFFCYVPDHEVVEMERQGEPEDFHLHPHGISVVEHQDGNAMLYVVNHEKKGKPRKTKHSIVVYRIEGDNLFFIEQLESDLLISPNDVVALPSGQLFVTNDSGRKTFFGKLWEMIFKAKNSTVVHYDGAGNWDIAAKKLSYANGIVTHEQKLYVAQVFRGTLWRFDFGDEGILTNRTALVDSVKGMDNLTIWDDRYLVTAAHPSFGDFIKHVKDPEHPSPGIVYAIDMESGEVRRIFQNDGTSISANSTGIVYDGVLHIGQVFEDFIWIVPVEW